METSEKVRRWYFAGWIRNTVYLVVLILAAPWLCWRSWKTGRYRSGIRVKFFGLPPLRQCSQLTSQHDDIQPRERTRIWLHGVSVGEVQLLKPLIERWKVRQPDWQFALSTTTDSGKEFARRIVDDDVEIFYFPLDFTWSVARTLNSLQPSMLVLGELELWPNLIEACEARGVPVAVINGRLSARSFARYQSLSWLTRAMFGKLSLVAAQSEANALRFRQCGAGSTTIVTGSIKFDNVSFDRLAPDVSNLRKWAGIMPQHRVWVMGSTQVGEEVPAARLWQQYHHEFPDLKLIVVPRHPDRFDQVALDLERTGVRLSRRSVATFPLNADDWDVLLVDTVGELKWWWGLAEIAVVGGSFGARGGQNMLEPAAYGANVAFGPNTSNFRDIVDLLLTGNAAVRLASLEELSSWMRQQLLDPQPGQARGDRARKIISSGAGALDRTLDALDELYGQVVCNQRNGVWR